MDSKLVWLRPRQELNTCPGAHRGRLKCLTEARKHRLMLQWSSLSRVCCTCTYIPAQDAGYLLRCAGLLEEAALSTDVRICSRLLVLLVPFACCEHGRSALRASNLKSLLDTATKCRLICMRISIDCFRMRGLAQLPEHGWDRPYSKLQGHICLGSALGDVRPRRMSQIGA